MPAMRTGKANANAPVEALQGAMDAQGMAFARQRCLLALSTPRHRDTPTVDRGRRVPRCRK